MMGRSQVQTPLGEIFNEIDFVSVYITLYLSNNLTEMHIVKNPE